MWTYWNKKPLSKHSVNTLPVLLPLLCLLSDLYTKILAERSTCIRLVNIFPSAQMAHVFLLHFQSQERDLHILLMPVIFFIHSEKISRVILILSSSTCCILTHFFETHKSLVSKCKGWMSHNRIEDHHCGSEERLLHVVAPNPSPSLQTGRRWVYAKCENGRVLSGDELASFRPACVFSDSATVCMNHSCASYGSGGLSAALVCSNLIEI